MFTHKMEINFNILSPFMEHWVGEETMWIATLLS